MHITSIVPALAHSRAHLGRKKGGKSKSRMWLEGPLYETRLICILRGLEVNMHEGIKWYACEQTTRSLRITVPTSEPFIFLLACNQADLVCTDWWFRTKDWTLRDVNLLRRKTLSREGKLERSWGWKRSKNHPSGCSPVHIFRPGYAGRLGGGGVRRSDRGQRSQKNRARMYTWKKCTALDTQSSDDPSNIEENVCWSHEFIFQSDFL